MVPPPPKEDYYAILEVDQSATTETITKCYRRLAKELHPDRNNKQDATESFQGLAQAYETLIDSSSRAAYDRVYHTVKQPRTSASAPKYAAPKPARPPSPPSEAAQIETVQKSKRERAARWHAKNTAFETSLAAQLQLIKELEQQIRNLKSILAAEAAAEAKKNGWATWILSPLYKTRQETEDEKLNRDRARQERTIERDLKERRLATKRADFEKEKSAVKAAKEEINAADACDDIKIRILQNKVIEREARARQAKEKAERERTEQLRREERERREKEAQAAAKASQKRQEQLIREMQAERARHEREAEEQRRRHQREVEEHRRRQKLCEHRGWWSKNEGHQACPQCDESWTYLLRCPGCAIKACPKCQYDLRPGKKRAWMKFDPDG